jgi:hypothetical protein
MARSVYITMLLKYYYLWSYARVFEVASRLVAIPANLL